MFLTHVHAAKPHYAVQIDDGDRGESIIDVGVKDVRRSPEPTPQPPHTERDGGETLIERLDKAIEGIQPLTGQSEDNIWRPANKAWEAMVAAREFLAAHPTPPGPVAGWREADRVGLAKAFIAFYWAYKGTEFSKDAADFLINYRPSALPPEPPVESGEE